MTRILFVFGTRPEAIKLCPLVRVMREAPAPFDVRVCLTAQHRELLDQVLGVFGAKADYDLDTMRSGQSLTQSTSRILAALEPVLNDCRPEMVLVQGDTTTTFCGALAAFYQRIPVGHVEAGLRTHDFGHPFPEELNRVMTTRLADMHFAATEGAASNLRAEGVLEDRIAVTGNTGIDAVLHIASQLEAGALKARSWPFLNGSTRLILVTAHRRENFGGGMRGICEALHRLAALPGIRIVYPVHPNPNVKGPVSRLLAGVDNVHLVEPLDYVSFVDLMRRAHILVTDSGGVQEEAPSLGKPVLVMREKTERPEAVEAGTAKLVGTDPERIVREVSRLLNDQKKYDAMARVHNPYGDGHASSRIRDLIHSFLNK